MQSALIAAREDLVTLSNMDTMNMESSDLSVLPAIVFT